MFPSSLRKKNHSNLFGGSHLALKQLKLKKHQSWHGFSYHRVVKIKPNF